MIVKNESKVITRLLQSVLPIIDCYCICDTGSTDNTCEIIVDYFTKNEINGKIIKEPFKNFEYNRNFSLHSCFEMSEYILLMDADMVLDIRNFNKNMLSSSDSFYILQGTDDFHYQNLRIVRNNGLYKYVGVTHEYINIPPNTLKMNILKNQLFIKDLGDGGCKMDKFERDVLLLQNGLKDEPTNVRYYFYLANTYHDLGQFKEAIDIYKKRIELNGWDQEVWFSYYRIGLCYKKLGKMQDAIYTWLDGYNYLPDRLEGLYEIIHYYRVSNKPKLAIVIYNICKNVLMKQLNRDDYLFLQNDVYVYKIYYEYTNCAFYSGITNISNEVIPIFNYCHNNNIITNLLSNLKFYKDVLHQTKVYIFNSSCISHGFKMKSSSASIIKYNNDTYLMNIRFVNYNIDENTGNYLDCQTKIFTSNKYLLLDTQFNILKEHLFQETPLDKQLYVGIEDIKLFKTETEEHGSDINTIQYIGTKIHSNNTIGLVTGRYNLCENEISDINEIKTDFNNNNCEKNWVFVEYANAVHIIYKWSPLQICKLNKSTNLISIVKEIQMPSIFSYSRGSTCGFKYNNQLWFVLHIVSYEAPRHYYHFIAVFDLEMNLLKYSAPFKFKGSPIEYCLGLIVEDERVIISYSCWDRTTELAIYDKTYIETMLNNKLN